MIAYKCICTPTVPCYGYGECCAIGGECYLTKNPAFAENGVCLDPENHPERFNSTTVDHITYYDERRNYVERRRGI